MIRLMPADLKLAVIASALDTDARVAAKVARQLGLRGLLFDAYSASLSLPDAKQVTSAAMTGAEIRR